MTKLKLGPLRDIPVWRILIHHALPNAAVPY
ncbi:hypothetical protein ACVIW2_006260 [Bradyrhizobium huanghuaihaiense]|jgi:hypothetical protein|uniref:Uncharacterized protein n=4 Tax=Bradyrhizobium TaxID=374 RepID=A0A8I1Y348_BRAEL|nr:hypothetical protein [Bradyrhizobium japonicum]MBP1291762.1 hypothetical protein [Bradyrhizobium elkanii]MCS3890955.1 hypothetical protein [Bradyrhizobium japonicum USDA 38]MCS4008756.1 hypothetical protein [Bradyrhizobium elkanii USDA 61]MBP1097955.1 hypothetical protein [Bradyrhizobium japonicum]